MLGDALDALKSLIAPHAAIPVGRHGSLLHEDEDCGSRIYANRGSGSSTSDMLSRILSERPQAATEPYRWATNGAREAVSQYRSKPLPALLNSPWPKARGLRVRRRVIQPHPARSAQNSRMLPIRFIRIPPTFEGASPSQASRGAIVLPAVKGVGARHAAPSERQQLEQQLAGPTGRPPASLHRCGLHGCGSGSQAGKVAAAISSAAPGGPHQPRQALLVLVQRHEA